MKGIVLAGGTGSRLWPITRSVSKQLLPVYDKPMIFYPISTLLLGGIKDILIITNPEFLESYKNLLGTGEKIGVNFSYSVQSSPRGLAESLIIGESFIADESCALILGDNIFYGPGLGSQIKSDSNQLTGARIFTYQVSNPSDYGVLNLDNKNIPISVAEKPSNPLSDLAITGLYLFDKSASNFARSVVPSARGELEIVSVLEQYLKTGNLSYSLLNRGTAWLDTGTPKSLNDAGMFIRIIEERTGLSIGCLEEISWRQGWINDFELLESAKKYGDSKYASYIRNLLN